MKKKRMPRSAAKDSVTVPVMNEVAERQTDTIASRPTAAPVQQRHPNNQVDGDPIPKASVTVLKVPKSKIANAAIPKQVQPIQENACNEVIAPSSESMHAIVLEVLSERHNRTGQSTSLAEVRSAKKPDRKGLREAVSILFRKPIVDLTDPVLDEIIEKIEAEAASDAENVAANLIQLVAHLRSLNCTTRDAIVDYFVAADQVLLELHAELRHSRPSPTRLRQMAAQYALDPRRPIDEPAHRIDIRSMYDGYEIAIAPPGTSNLKSIPLPGIIVNDPFKCLLLGLMLSGPPHYTDLMQLIEMLLGYVPAENKELAQNPVLTPSTAVQVDVEESSIVVFGRHYVVELQQVRFMQLLLKAPGVWISTRKFHADPLFEGVRMDRIRDTLPSVLLDLIESKGGKGYRLMVERLE
ncbi:MAG: hypothetical protein K8U03_22205 [Planctomycetia bacterium]|nr:hypothetical protein [Planctomycetia bacterium]